MFLNFVADSLLRHFIQVISFLIGLVTIGEIFVVEHLGTIFEMAFSISSAVDGPVFGLFVLGMFVPMVGRKGANVGTLLGMLIMVWIVAGSQWHVLHKTIHYEELPTSTKKCGPLLSNLTSINKPKLNIEEKDEPFFIFKISFLYLVPLGALLTVVIGVITSAIVGENDANKVNPRYISPLLRR